MTHLRHSRLLMVLSEIHTDRLDLVAIESIHADRSGPDGRRGVDVQGEEISKIFRNKVHAAGLMQPTAHFAFLGNGSPIFPPRE
jgi:hypothetical protein